MMCTNWTVFDTFAPTVATWHYGEFDEMAYAQMELWDLMDMFISHFFKDVFPAGGLFTAIQ